MSRKWIVALSVVGGLIVILVATSLLLPSESVTSDGDTHLLALGPITVRIQHPELAVEDPDQYLGVRHELPRFNTQHLGEDLNLVVGQLDFKALEGEPVVNEDKIMRAVYLGHDPNGVPVYIYSEGTENFLDLIFRFFIDEGNVGRFGSTYHCCVNAPLASGVMGEPVELVYTIPGVESTVVAEWHHLDDEVSVVALEVEGEPIGWQTPTSGSSLFRIDVAEIDDPSQETIVMIAYDINGEKLART